MTNTDLAAKKAYVDRMVAIESEFAEAKAEYTDLVKDLKGEIKNRKEETGVDPKEVVRLAKIRIKENEAREAAAQLDDDLSTYDVLYGRAQDDVDPLA